MKLQDLAEIRGIDPEKLSKGLLLKELSIAPLTEDIVTLAASAGNSILTEEEKQEIDMVTLRLNLGLTRVKLQLSLYTVCLGFNHLLVVLKSRSLLWCNCGPSLC